MRTSDVAAVIVVDLLHASVAEGEFAHPVDAAANARRQAQTGVRRRRPEAIRREVIITATR